MPPQRPSILLPERIFISLERGLVDQRIQGKKFAPHNLISERLGVDRISRLFGFLQLQLSKDSCLLQGNGPKILATIIYSVHKLYPHEHIRNIELKRSLSQLVRRSTLPSNFPLDSLGLSRLKLDATLLSQFSNDQFIFQPWVLKIDDHAGPLSDGVILPFVDATESNCFSSAAKIYKADIAPGYWRYKLGQVQLNVSQCQDSMARKAADIYWKSRTVAIKILKRDETGPDAKQNRKEFDQERMILAGLKLSSPRENILLTLTSFETPLDLGIVLEWSDIGDLNAFFKEERFTSDEQRRRQNILGLLEVAKAIHSLEDIQIDHEGSHERVKLFHCDLKPANILVFPGRRNFDDVIFKLADFGLAIVTVQHFSKDREAQILFPRKKATFTPPELDDDKNDNIKIKDTSDAWTFGCILLMMAIFSWGGLKGLKSFGEARSQRDQYGSFYLGPPQNVIKPIVKEMFTNLESNKSALAKEIASVLKQEALVYDWKSRSPMAELVRQISDIYDRTDPGKLEARCVTHTEREKGKRDYQFAAVSRAGNMACFSWQRGMRTARRSQERWSFEEWPDSNFDAAWYKQSSARSKLCTAHEMAVVLENDSFEETQASNADIMAWISL